VAKPAGSTAETGFGSVLRGRSETQQAIARHADTLSTRRSNNQGLTKEHNSVVLCLWGAGTGKSRLLASGLETHHTHCKDPALKEILKDPRRCLQILTTFNNNTSYAEQEGENGEKILARRLLAAVTEMPWEEAQSIPLDGFSTCNACIEAIAAYHRRVNGLADDAELFIFIGIDDIHKLITQTRYDGGEMVRSVCRALRNLNAIPRVALASMIAGTHDEPITNSLLGHSIEAVHLEYRPLAVQDVEAIITQDAGLSERYLQDQDFREVLADAFPVLPAIAQAVAHLPCSYDPAAIPNARRTVGAYFDSMAGPEDIDELETLVMASLSGAASTRVSLGLGLQPGSKTSLDSLQNTGTIQLVRTADGLFQVAASLCLLRRWVCMLTGRPYYQLVNSLLCSASHSTCVRLEKVVAQLLSLKFENFRRAQRTAFTLDMLFPTATLSADLKDAVFQIPAELPQGMLSHSGLRYLTVDHPDPDSTHAFLREGGVVVNPTEAPVGVLAFLDARDGYAADEKQGAGLAVVFHSNDVGRNELLIENVQKCQKNAIASFRTMQPPRQKRHCVVVHIFGRDVPVQNVMNAIADSPPDGDAGATVPYKASKRGDRWKRQTSAVIVDGSSFKRLVGPVLGNLLASRRPATRSYVTVARAIVHRALILCK
jgi:hypothetical protein